MGAAVQYKNQLEIQSIITTGKDTIAKSLIPDNKFKSINTFSLPIFSIEKKKVDAFITEKGEKVSKYTRVSSYYNYTIPMMIFTSFGLLALIFAFLLKAEDKKKGYGLESPNVVN